MPVVLKFRLVLPVVLAMAMSGCPDEPPPPDTKPPQLTLNGTSTPLIECGTPYIELGATAVDEGDGDLSGQVLIQGSELVNTRSPGTYRVTYDVQDRRGNRSPQQVRTVTVRDSGSPTIRLLGPPRVTINCGETFNDPGVSASDLCSGTLAPTSDATTAIPSGQAGEFTVTYTATDDTGNRARVTRTVIVQDTVPPVIAILGSDPLTVDCASGALDPGATAVDACTGNLQVTSNAAEIFASPAGTYMIIYTARDTAGNLATAQRTVVIEGPNCATEFDNKSAAAFQQACEEPPLGLRLRVSALLFAEGFIAIPGLEISIPFTADVLVPFEVAIPTEALVTEEGVITGQGIFIAASGIVLVELIQDYPDGTYTNVALPIEAASLEHRVPAVDNPLGLLTADYTLVATEDNTEITLLASGPEGGTPLTLSLNRFETFTLPRATARGTLINSTKLLILYPSPNCNVDEPE